MVRIDGVELKLIIDTWSSISLIQPDVAVVGDIVDANVTPIGVTGATLCFEGEQQVEFRLHNCTLRHPFCLFVTDRD
jgi:hypothetical protein